jgi:hypothetical protein
LRLFNLLPGDPLVLALVAESVVEYLLYCCLEGPASDGSYGRLGGRYSDDMGDLEGDRILLHETFIA